MLTVNGAKSKITRPVNRIHRNGDIKKTSWQAGLAKQAWFVMSHATGKNEIVGKTAGQIFMRYHQSADPTNAGKFMVSRSAHRLFLALPGLFCWDKNTPGLLLCSGTSGCSVVPVSGILLRGGKVKVEVVTNVKGDTSIRRILQQTWYTGFLTLFRLLTVSERHTVRRHRTSDLLVIGTTWFRSGFHQSPDNHGILTIAEAFRNTYIDILPCEYHPGYTVWN